MRVSLGEKTENKKARYAREHFLISLFALFCFMIKGAVLSSLHYRLTRSRQKQRINTCQQGTKKYNIHSNIIPSIIVVSFQSFKKRRLQPQEIGVYLGGLLR